MEEFVKLEEALVEVRRQAKKLQAEIEALHRERKGEVWYWQGEAEDHLESLTCPVLIEADDLRALLERGPK